ncbi:hypothetical protein [Mesorhizobium sp. M2A.F.Ca.ET.042.01.1.1]|nr:hypothetical protein [Mesorhizobium sp. M2A.F.Ca.ET.042.01.1.1]
MLHWLDKLTDLAAIPSDECMIKGALWDFAERVGLTAQVGKNS